MKPDAAEAYFGRAFTSYQTALRAFHMHIEERGVDLSVLLPPELRGTEAISLQAAEYARAHAKGAEKQLQESNYNGARVAAKVLCRSDKPLAMLDKALQLRPDYPEAAELRIIIADLMESPKSKRPGGCYIATACYGSYEHPDVQRLRAFRDQQLAASTVGRMAIHLYYEVSPAIAMRVRDKRIAQMLRRWLLEPTVRKLRSRDSRASRH